MKDKFYTIIYIIGFIVMVGCAIASIVFAIQNPDMTEMRRLIEYPWPTIVLGVDLIILGIVRSWWDI